MNVHVAPFSLHFACSDGCIGSRRCVFRTRSMSVMRLFRVLLLWLGALGSGLALAQAVSFTSAGAYSYTVPSGVTRLGLCGAGAESGAAGCGVKRPQTASDIAGTRTAHAALRTSGCCLAV